MYIGEIVHKGVRKRKFKYSRKKGNYRNVKKVLRPKDPKKAELIAQAMEMAIKNKNKIKYSNGSKCTDLYDKAKPHKFDISKVKKKAYVNCSVLFSICCRYAGIKTPKRANSLKLYKQVSKEDFDVINYKEGMKLKRGDCLNSTLRPSPHTAVVL